LSIGIFFLGIVALTVRAFRQHPTVTDNSDYGPQACHPSITIILASLTMAFIYINGYPGVGKLTVARELK